MRPNYIVSCRNNGHVEKGTQFGVQMSPLELGKFVLVQYQIMHNCNYDNAIVKASGLANPLIKLSKPD